MTAIAVPHPAMKFPMLASIPPLLTAWLTYGNEVKLTGKKIASSWLTNEYM